MMKPWPAGGYCAPPSKKRKNSRITTSSGQQSTSNFLVYS